MTYTATRDLETPLKKGNSSLRSEFKKIYTNHFYNCNQKVKVFLVRKTHQCYAKKVLAKLCFIMDWILHVSVYLVVHFFYRTVKKRGKDVNLGDI